MEYILTIVAVVFLGVMLDVIAPEGKTNPFIKSMFALFLLFVILTPVVNFFTGDNFKTLINSTYNLNEGYLDDVLDLRLSELETNVVAEVEKQGIMGVGVEIIGYMQENNLVVQKVVVDAQNIVLINEDKHIDKYKVITEIIAEVLDIKSEVIEYEGG